MKTINDEIGLKNNLQWQCSKCKTFNDVAKKVCQKCGVGKNKFLDVMSERTDEQLREVIESPVGDYQPEAVEAAKQEIEKRGLIQPENRYPTEAKQEISASESHYEPYQRNTPESALRTIAAIVLACGIIVSIVLLIFGISMISGYDEMTGFATILSIIPVLLSSIVVWGLLRVFCNISLNIKDIKEKLK